MFVNWLCSGHDLERDRKLIIWRLVAAIQEMTMKKHWIIMMVVMILSLPILAAASDCCPSEAGSGTINHGTMNDDMMSHEQGSMSMNGEMIMLGAEVKIGVKGMAHLKDVRTAMTKMGMATTHHLMMMFSNAQSGQSVDQGSVAVKVTTPSGKQLKALKLMGMQGHFGADVTLDETGTYQFSIGTRLDDGQKRVYSFSYDN